MKPSMTYLITCFAIIFFVMISIVIEHHYRRQSLDMRSKEIMFYTTKLEDFKKELKNKSDESVTKADLADLIDMNYYQSQKDKLYMENQFELAKGYPMVFPDYFILLMILWLCFIWMRYSGRRSRIRIISKKEILR